MGLGIVGKLGRHLVGECNLDVVAWSLVYMGAWVDSDLYSSILRTKGMLLKLNNSILLLHFVIVCWENDLYTHKSCRNCHPYPHFSRNDIRTH